ncbi:MAG: penicillin-binding protein activator, partial [Sphingomonadaceae bacterium]|nr:penicillin-binding protein activator [Sphingomonadaceae bacterium]
ARNRVALLVPTTGPNAAVGQSIASAATMALLDTQAVRIDLQVYDTAPGAAAAAAKALGEGAKLILGPLLAADVRAVQPLASAANVPVLTFSNDAALAGGGTYVLGFQPNQAIARVVAYARSRGVERFAALVPAGVYGQRSATAFLRAVEAAGGKVVAVQTYPRTSAGLLLAARKLTGYDARAAAATKTAALRPDGTVAQVSKSLAPVAFQALLIADTGQIAAAVAPALAQFGAGNVIVLGTELWGSEPGLPRATALHGAVFAAVPDDRFRQLAARYRDKFGGSPSRLASLGYDGVLLAASAASGWMPGTPFPRAALTAASGFTGIDGFFRFGPSGVAERGLEVEQVAATGFAVVAPAKAE